MKGVKEMGNVKQMFLSAHAAAGMIRCTKADIREMVKLHVLGPLSPIGALRINRCEIETYLMQIFWMGKAKEAFKKEALRMWRMGGLMEEIICRTHLPRSLVRKLVRAEFGSMERMRAAV
jgi:hypothetical protein